MARAFLTLLLLAMATGAWAQPAAPRPPHLITPPEREAVWLFEEAQRLQRSGEVGRAIEVYRKALVQDPGRLEYRPYLGLALDQTGQPQQAVEQYDLYLKREPSDTRVRLMRAAALLHQDDLAAAGRELEALASLRGEDPYLHNLHGLLLLRQNQPGPAAQEFEAALAIKTTLLEARINLAAARLAQGQLEAARAQLDEVLRQAPQDPRALNNLGVLEGHQSLDTAVQTLEKLVGPADSPTLSASVPEALLNLASLLARQGQDKEALLVVARLLDLQPNMLDAHLLDARLLMRQGRLEEARKEADLVLAAGPESLGALWAYASEVSGMVYLAQKQWDSARNDLEKATLAAPERASAHHNLALALGQLADFPRGLEEEQKALALAGDVPAMWYHLGLLYELDTLTVKAVQAYKKFLELAPQDPQAAGLKEHMAELEARASGEPGSK